MLENVNEVAVLVSTLLAMAVGSIWYSPLLFGKLWMQATGMTEADMEASKAQMPKQLVFAFVGNFILLYTLAHFVALSRLAETSLGAVAVCLSIFLTAIMSNAVIWENRPLAYLLINAGYAVVIIFGGIAVIGYWPW